METYESTKQNFFKCQKIWNKAYNSYLIYVLHKRRSYRQ